MKIIVISTITYREKSAIVNALTKDESISFTMHKAQGKGSEFPFLNTPLTVADVTLTDGNSKHKTLISANLEFNPLTMPQTIQVLTASCFVKEFVNKLVEFEEQYKLYDAILETIRALNENDSVYMPLIYLCVRCLAVSGYELNLNTCVRCGSTTNINKFSFEEGGFICKECYDESISNDLTVNQMKILRLAGLCKECRFDTLDLDKNDILIVFNKLLAFINDCFGISFKNTSLLAD